MKFTIGDKVKILECHSLPNSIGKIGTIAQMTDPKLIKYPYSVVFDQPVMAEGEDAEGHKLSVPFTGYMYKEEELEKAVEGVPDNLKKWFEGEPKKD
jgi:hypothetical protein